MRNQGYDSVIALSQKYGGQPELLRFALLGTGLFGAHRVSKPTFLDGVDVARDHFVNQILNPELRYSEKIDFIGLIERGISDNAPLFRLLKSLVAMVRSPGRTKITAEDTARAKAASEILIPRYVSIAEVAACSVFDLTELEPLLNGYQPEPFNLYDGAFHDKDAPQILAKLRTIGSGTIFQAIADLPTDAGIQAYERLVQAAVEAGWLVTLKGADSAFLSCKKRSDLEQVELAMLSRMPFQRIQQIIRDGES